MIVGAGPIALSAVLGAGPLGAERRAALRAIALAAAALGTPAWLVGGAVRDACLALDPGEDLDIVVEGDAVAMAGRLAGAHGDRPVVHRRFGTATWRYGRLTVDLVAARSESYARPGALPTVRAGALSDDLARRDFALNAMALALVDAGLGELIDPHDGLGALERGRVGILYARSFADDPTRVFRAARFAARLGFTLDPETDRLARAAVGDGALASVSPARIARELHAVFREARPGHVLAHLDDLGVIARLGGGRADAGDPPMDVLPESGRAERAADAFPAAWARLARGAPGLALPASASAATRRAIWAASALRLPGSWRPSAVAEQRVVAGVEGVGWREAAALERATPSRLAAALRERPAAAIAGAWLLAPSSAARAALRRHAESAGMRCPIDGHDLRAIGIASGPALGRVLARVHGAWLDGIISTRDAALRLAQELAAAEDGVS